MVSIKFDQIVANYCCVSSFTNYFSRHVIRYMKQCFFNRDTWSECNEQVFMAQAHACALESLKNIHDPADGKNSNKIDHLFVK